jgi:hypothetical protein
MLSGRIGIAQPRLRTLLPAERYPARPSPQPSRTVLPRMHQVIATFPVIGAVCDSIAACAMITHK